MISPANDSQCSEGVQLQSELKLTNLALDHGHHGLSNLILQDVVFTPDLLIRTDTPQGVVIEDVKHCLQDARI